MSVCLSAACLYISVYTPVRSPVPTTLPTSNLAIANSAPADRMLSASKRRCLLMAGKNYCTISNVAYLLLSM